MYTVYLEVLHSNLIGTAVILFTEDILLLEELISIIFLRASTGQR